MVIMVNHLVPLEEAISRYEGMITTVDVETSWQKNENGGYDPSPFHPDNILVSVGINDEYYFTNHSERIDKGCYNKIQSTIR